ncbi:MAG: hypothetical protein AABZ44_00845 [Elusimicrobiota bacterium]
MTENWSERLKQWESFSHWQDSQTDLPGQASINQQIGELVDMILSLRTLPNKTDVSGIESLRRNLNKWHPGAKTKPAP